MRDDLAALRPQLIQIAKSADTGDGAHDLSHLERVWKAAASMLAHHPEADAVVVMAASYLHDLVNLPKNHPDRARASAMAADQAVRELQAIGYPPAKLAALHHAIEAHSYSANIPPRTIEARMRSDRWDWPACSTSAGNWGGRWRTPPTPWASIGNWTTASTPWITSS
jgi:uncharacterized protein